MRYPQPNASHRHIYVVFRFDSHGLPVSDQSFSLTKAFHTEAEAIQEVERLNKSKSDKGCLYDYRVTRLVEGS